MSPALSLYLALTSVAAPAVRFALRRRLAAGKEDPERLPERLGHASRPRPAGPLVWLHAASVGEGLSLLPLLGRLRAQRPDLAVLVTSGTVTSARLLAERLPKGAIHQFIPVDTGPAVSRFLDHWRPDLAVWIESEIWPRLVSSTAAANIPALLLNARLSPRSRARWRRLPSSGAKLFSVFDYVQAQDDETAEALRDLGVQPGRLRVAGSFKESADPLPFDEAELDRLRTALSDRFVWVAASTHPGEEEFVVRAHARVSERIPDPLLILAPRHPGRGDEVAALLDASRVAWTRRAEGLPARGTSVYLADTLGELGLWYRLGRAAYVGGSGGCVGGHNPYEPVALGVPVLHGPDTANFSDIYRRLDASAGARVVTTPEALADAVVSLATGAEASAMTEQAARVVGTGSEALDLAVAAILERLPLA